MHESASFPRFSEFPLEVQDRIWELAIPVFKHAAYNVDVDLDRDPTRIRGKTQYVDQIFTVFRLVPNKFDTFTACQALRATCRRAAAAAERVIAAEMLPVDGYISGSPTVELRPPHFPSTGGAPVPGRQGVSLNAKIYNDLMILTPLGQQQIQQLFFQYTLGTVNTGLKPEVRRPNSHLNYLAVHWPPTVETPDDSNREPFWLRAGAMLLALFPHLKALYAIVDPAELLQMDGTVWDFRELLRQTPQAERPVASLHDVTDDEFADALRLDANGEHIGALGQKLRFRDGEREFFEVPYSIIRRCGKLLRAMVMLEGARARARMMMEGMLVNHDRTIRIDPLKVGILTWRVAR